VKYLKTYEIFKRPDTLLTYPHVTIDTPGDIETDIEDEERKINIIKKYFNFNDVVGSIYYEVEVDRLNVDLLFKNDKDFTIEGIFNTNTEILKSIFKNGNVEIDFNYHPFDTMGGIDFEKFEKEIQKIYKLVNNPNKYEIYKIEKDTKKYNI